jgi:hypothetical protein
MGFIQSFKNINNESFYTLTRKNIINYLQLLILLRIYLLGLRIKITQDKLSKILNYDQSSDVTGVKSGKHQTIKKMMKLILVLINTSSVIYFKNG